MEIVAMEMKHRGMYIARQLSFKDVTFKVDEVVLTPAFIHAYDESVKLWVHLLQSFTEAAELVNADPKMRKTMWAQFWSAHQRFFKYLCIAAKVKHAVKVASDAVKCGKCVVIGLQSTGEARTLEQIENEGELSDFVSTAKGVLQSLVEKHFPAPDRSRVLRLLGLDKSSLLDQLGIDPESYEEGGMHCPFFQCYCLVFLTESIIRFCFFILFFQDQAEANAKLITRLPRRMPREPELILNPSQASSPMKTLSLNWTTVTRNQNRLIPRTKLMMTAIR